jgi:hypothetical protein
MQLFKNDEEIIEKLKKSKQLITVLFIISAFLGTICFVFFKELLFYGTGFLLYLAATLSVPKINRVKEDIKNVKEKNLEETIEKVKDYFPEKGSGKANKWILITDFKDKEKEYIINKDLNLKRDDYIRIKQTTATKMPVEIEKL